VENTRNLETTTGAASESDSWDEDSVALEATVDETVEIRDAETGRKTAASAEAGEETDFPGGAAGKSKSLDEQKSYDQFKRWLENMKK
jgi:hypothetical protein